MEYIKIFTQTVNVHNPDMYDIQEAVNTYIKGSQDDLENVQYFESRVKENTSRVTIIVTMSTGLSHTNMTMEEKAFEAITKTENESTLCCNESLNTLEESGKKTSEAEHCENSVKQTKDEILSEVFENTDDSELENEVEDDEDEPEEDPEREAEEREQAALEQ